MKPDAAAAALLARDLADERADAAAALLARDLADQRVDEATPLTIAAVGAPGAHGLPHRPLSGLSPTARPFEPMATFMPTRDSQVPSRPVFCQSCDICFDAEAYVGSRPLCPACRTSPMMSMMPPIAVHVHLPAHMLLPDARCVSAPDGRASDALEDLDGGRPSEPFRRDDEPEWLTHARSQLEAAEGA